MKKQFGVSVGGSVRGLGLSAVVGLGILLGGCSQFPSFSDASVLSSSTSVDWKSQSGLDAQTMYQILVAEMLIKREQPAAAFDLLYPLAKKLKDPQLVKYVFQLSMFTYQVSKIEAATQLWLSLNPKEATPWKAAFLMSIRKGEIEAALQQWQKWQKLTEAPLYQDILNSAQKVARTTSPKEGLAFIQKLAHHFPDNWAAQLALGWLAADQGNVKLAWSALNKTWQLAQPLPSGKEKVFAQQKTAQILMEVALKAPLYGAKVLDELLADYIAQHPEELALQQQVARLQIQMQRFTQAKQTFQKILQQDADNTAALFGLGVLALQMEDLKTAEQSFQILKNQPSYQTVAFYYLGRIAQGRKQWTLAERYFKQVDKGPFELDAQIQLALLQVTEKQGVKGLAAAQQRLDSLLQALQSKSQKSNDKARAKIWSAKAKLYVQAGEVQKAIEAYRKATVLLPEAQWQFALAALLYDSKQFDDYQKVLKNILQQTPNDADALNALGFFYVEQGKNLDEAKVLLERAIEVAPDRYYIMDSLGWWYFMKGDYPKAEQWLEKALRKQMDEEVLIHLIEAKWHAGKTQEAIKLWQKHHAQFPKNAKLQSLMKQLQQKGSTN